MALDIDGTLGDYHGHFAGFASMYLGVHSLEADEMYDGGDPYREWFCETYGVDETTFREIKLAYRQGAMKRSMPIFPAAAQLTRMVRDLGAELWLTTTRPWERFDRVDPDTRWWLERNEIEYDGLIYDDDKYSVLFERVEASRVVTVLDDEEAQLVEASKLFNLGVPVLARTWHNRFVNWGAETTLDEADYIIARQINQWELRNG